MKQVNVGILGATGAVGQEMIKILEERNFPVASLRPIASARSAGSKIMFRGQECTIVEASDDAFEGLDIVLGAAENDIAERFAPSIVKAGAVFVDNSSAFRLDPNVPLVIPEINPEDVDINKLFKNAAEIGKASVNQKRFSMEARAAIKDEARRELLAEQKAQLDALGNKLDVMQLRAAAAGGPKNANH